MGEKKQPESYALIRASFDLEANKQNYQKLLQDLSATTVTIENVNDDLTKDGREVLKSLEKIKEEKSLPYRQGHQNVLLAHKSLSEPLKEQVDRILAEKKQVSLRVQEDQRKQLDEQIRIANAKQAIVNFVNKVANLIKTATIDKDIVAIEMMIGSEKTKKSLYQEFLPDLIIQCDGLRPQVKDQKENIRALQMIAEREKIAQETGNIIELTELRGQKEHIQSVIEETGIRIHEKAYEQAITIDIVAPEVAETVPKGRTNWKWEVVDIKLLQKKMPHLVKLIPDEDAINNLLKTKRIDGSLDDKMEENMFGLRFFNDKTFTR